MGKPHLDAAVCRRMFGCDEVAMTFSLTNVQQDPTYSVYYISVGSATCFGCWNPSSGAGTAVITASGID